MGRFWLILAVAAAVAGCGLKGPLYLPKEKPEQKQAPKNVPSAPSTGSGQPS
jgi:predicted small lipoprotein YifL